MAFVQLPEIRIHYLEEGAGPPLVWLPGGNDSALLMRHAHRRLAARVRLICMDPRGQGESDSRTEPEDYLPAAYAGDVLGLLDALGLERVVLGGHSRGGRTSMEVALRYPERVVAVIAAASPLLGYETGRIDGLRHNQLLLREQGVDAFLNGLNWGPRNPERHAYWRAAAQRAGADALIAQYEALSRLPTLTTRLPDLQPPALFLSGERDFMLEAARQAAAATPNSRLIVIPDAGHALFADQPDAYFRAFNAFLDEVL